MAINIQMPALSPTMEEGTLSKWLVKEGDTVKSGDVMAEIETDKATMEFEAVDEGVIGKIVVPEGTDGVKVGTVIAVLVEEARSVPAAAPPAATAPKPEPEVAKAATASPAPAATPAAASAAAAHPASTAAGDRIKASPLAKRIAAQSGVDLGSVKGTGPNGRIVKADIEGKSGAPAPAAAPAATAPTPRCPRAGRGTGLRHPARGREALEHPQDDRAPPDRIEADDPAHLFDGRHSPRRAAEAARRTQQGARATGREALGQ